MARVAVQGTYSANGAHGAGHTTDPGTSGNVFLAFDNSAIQSFSDLRKIVLAMLAVIEGSADLARK